jgi:dihydrofolate reductase
MSSSVLYMSMSLDGFITGPDDGPGQGLGRGGERLHDWLGAGGGPNDFRPEGPSAQIFDEVMATGSVLVGRRTFDIAGRWNGDHHGVPIFVPTRGEPPEPAKLELTRVVDAPGVTHLRFRVRA